MSKISEAIKKTTEALEKSQRVAAAVKASADEIKAGHAAAQKKLGSKS